MLGVLTGVSDVTDEYGDVVDLVCFSPKECPNGFVRPGAKLLMTPSDATVYHVDVDIRTTAHTGGCSKATQH